MSNHPIINFSSLIDTTNSLTLPPNKLGQYLSKRISQEDSHCEYTIGRNHLGTHQTFLIIDNKLYTHTQYITEFKDDIATNYRIWEPVIPHFHSFSKCEIFGIGPKFIPYNILFSS